MSARYIHFTDAQKEQARQTDLVSLLKSQGEKLKRSGSEYEWRDGSQKVTVRGNLWFHQYERTGGDAVDFVGAITARPTLKRWSICSQAAIERSSLLRLLSGKQNPLICRQKTTGCHESMRI